MSTKVTTLLQGEGPDLPDNGDIVFADVEIWKFDPEKPDNHYKGDKCVTQIFISVVEANISFRILGPKRFTFQVGQVFMGEHEWLSFLHEQVKETFINGRTRL